MFSEKIDLLTQINSIIHRNPASESTRKVDFDSIQQFITVTKEAVSRDYLPVINSRGLGKLEERIQKLEDESDQLLCVIQFLLQKLSDLMDNMSDADHSTENKLPAEDRPTLTKREIDVFKLLAKGLCAKEIAKVLYISETTVITHKRNLKTKFNAKNTVELISNVLAYDTSTHSK